VQPKKNRMSKTKRQQGNKIFFEDYFSFGHFVAARDCFVSRQTGSSQ
jgi:hypothetical protein